METRARVGRDSRVKVVSPPAKRKGEGSGEIYAASVEDPWSHRTRPFGSPGVGSLDSESEASDHESGGGHGGQPRRPPPMVRKSEAGQGARSTSITTRTGGFGGAGSDTVTAVRRRDTEREGMQVSVVHLPVPNCSNVIRFSDHGTLSAVGSGG